MNNINFKVSVIIPLYNAEKYVSKTVEPALQFPEVKEEAEKQYRNYFPSELTTVASLVNPEDLFPGEIHIPVAKRGVHDNNRILNIQNEHKQKARNQVKLWDSLHQWSQNAGLPGNDVKHLWCMKTSKQVVAQPYLPSVFYFLFSFMKNRNLLTNPVFYNAIHYRFFGRGKASVFLLRAKNKLLRILLMQRG